MDFKAKELGILRDLKSKQLLPPGRVFGREEEFNLSWKLLVENQARFLRVVKADHFPLGYPYALFCLTRSIRDESRYVPTHWSTAAGEILFWKRDRLPDFKFLKETPPADFVRLADEQCWLELVNDLGNEAEAGLWRAKDDEGGLPERLFDGGNRVSFVEVEMIESQKACLEMLAFILFHCWESHKLSVEAHRAAQHQGLGDDLLKPTEEGLKHTFVLIDEIQNYAAEGTSDPHQRMLGDLIHRIAAEGRKYGLHLILATQRPNKVKRGLLGECDNAVIMKMNSRSDLEHLAREMRILDVKLLEPCLHFQGQGNAIALGEMTRMAPYVQLFKSAPRRTREGGVDIEGF